MFFAAETWRNLPAEIVAIIQQITGADGKKQKEQRHLFSEYPDENQPIVYVIGYPNKLGTVYGQRGNQVTTLQVNSGDFYFQRDSNRWKSSPDTKGQLDPSVSVLNTDVFSFDLNTVTTTAQKDSGNKARKVIQTVQKCAFHGPAYLWPHQYLAELPSDVLQKFLDWPGSTGRALGDTYILHLCSPPRSIEAISRIPDGADLDSDRTVMAGEMSSIPVRLGMGVEFRAGSFGVPSLSVLAGVIVAISDESLFKVRCVLKARQLPPPGNHWQKLDVSSGFQTNWELLINPSDVIRSLTCFPTELWQYKEKTDDLHILGSIEIVVDSSVATSQLTPSNLLPGLYGHGPLVGQVKMHIHRAAPLEARVAFNMVAQDLPRIHSSDSTLQHSIRPYEAYFKQRLQAFAQEKATRKMPDRSTADNTMHVSGFDPRLFLRVLDKFLNINACEVALEDGVFAITALTWADAARLLSPGQADGRFDFRADGRGVVEMFAPIVFKWEMYDTTRGRDTSRSPDGFVAITFSGYEERDRHDNPDGIKDTRQHPHSKRQMNMRPSACPGFSC